MDPSLGNAVLGSGSEFRYDSSLGSGLGNCLVTGFNDSVIKNQIHTMVDTMVTRTIPRRIGAILRNVREV